VTNITEHNNSRDLAATNTQRRISWLIAAIKVSTTSAKDITNDLRSQGVTG
jgi:hypothetical protein